MWYAIYTINDSQKVIQIALPNPRVFSCEIYNRLAFKKIFSLSYPEYTTDISFMDELASQTTAEFPGETASKDQVSNSNKQ